VEVDTIWFLLKIKMENGMSLMMNKLQRLISPMFKTTPLEDISMM